MNNQNISIIPLSDWAGINKNEPLHIAGPCSAESEEQVMNIAKELASMGVKIFRCGIWKPRTRPNSFEGMGKKALQWLQRVKAETGMLTAIEVANANHVYEAMKHGIDIVWIGARTTVNPFTVQEIADALEGIDIPVMIKNPVNPDIDLWIGAIERMAKSGITKLAVIHRGFTSFEKHKYRNPPNWQIPIELKRRLPEIPIICDPSHIAGNRDYLQELSQRAIDLDFNGIMLEVHDNPENALSDKNQQITPAQYKKLLGNIVSKSQNIEDEKTDNILGELRSQIDSLDKELMQVLTLRMKVAEKIGHIKLKKNITVLQSTRWKEIVKSRVKSAGKTDLSQKFMMKLLTAIHEESINKQLEIIKEKDITERK